MDSASPSPGALQSEESASKTQLHALEDVREDLWTAAGPVVIFNKSHSGSRLVANMVEAGGVFMGAHQNNSKDSLDVYRLVQHLVLRHYPNYATLWDRPGAEDPHLPALVRAVFTSHLEGFDGKGLWGWKVGETAYILPVVDYLFPNARFIHVIRDGRDVAFSDHHAPDSPFRKKVYFNTDSITTWRGLRLTRGAYRKRSHIFNSRHWTNSVQVGRSFGAKLGDRYLEMRYEDLCESFEAISRRALEFIGLGRAAPAVAAELSAGVHRDSVHKYEKHPKHKLDEVLEITKPLLRSLGYLQGDDSN